MKNSLRKILYILCILGAGLCIGFFAYYYSRLQENKKIYENLQSQPETESLGESVDTLAESIENSTKSAENRKKPEISVDFSELQQINPEIYAWIEIPGTEVNYPIVQSASDNSYYLNHTIEGISGYPGSIYSEGINSRDFQDYNTLIYGHDMEDGSMFGGLYKFADAEYLKAHETLFIYTPEQKFTYRIFMAVTYDDRHIMGSFDFSDKKDREAYLTSIGNTDSEVSADDRIITLSTCIAGQPSNRFLVEAVLINEE